MAARAASRSRVRFSGAGPGTKESSLKTSSSNHSMADRKPAPSYEGFAGELAHLRPFLVLIWFKVLV